MFGCGVFLCGFFVLGGFFMVGEEGREGEGVLESEREEKARWVSRTREAAI